MSHSATTIKAIYQAFKDDAGKSVLCEQAVKIAAKIHLAIVSEMGQYGAIHGPELQKKIFNFAKALQDKTVDFSIYTINPVRLAERIVSGDAGVVETNLTKALASISVEVDRAIAKKNAREAELASLHNVNLNLIVKVYHERLLKKLKAAFPTEGESAQLDPSMQLNSMNNFGNHNLRRLVIKYMLVQRLLTMTAYEKKSVLGKGKDNDSPIAESEANSIINNCIGEGKPYSAAIGAYRAILKAQLMEYSFKHHLKRNRNIASNVCSFGIWSAEGRDFVTKMRSSIVNHSR